MDVTLHPKQSEIWRSPARFKVIRCGRRFGKSYLSATLIIAKALESKGDYWFIAPTYKQAKEIAWRMITELMPPAAIGKKNETELSMDLKNGSRIVLKGADNPDSLRGVGIAGCVLDEYAFTKPFVWEEVVRPMLFDSGGWAMFISTPYGYNHFYELWESASDKGEWARFHFTTYDNPHIKAEEVDEAKLTMSTERFNQEIMAEFTKKSGAIWPNFSRAVHVVPRVSPPEGATIFGSIDFGFSIGHMTAVLWHAVDGEQVYTFDGFGIEQETMPQILERMKLQTGGLFVSGIFPDPARPDLIEELKRAGWPMREVNKDKELGIAKVAEYMQINPLTNKPRWTISEHLKDAIRQIEEYEWMEVRGDDGRYTQKPRDVDNHFPDSIRYFMHNYANKQRRSDGVRTFKDHVSAPRTGYKTKAKVFR